MKNHDIIFPFWTSIFITIFPFDIDSGRKREERKAARTDWKQQHMSTRMICMVWTSWSWIPCILIHSHSRFRIQTSRRTSYLCKYEKYARGGETMILIVLLPYEHLFSWLKPKGLTVYEFLRIYDWFMIYNLWSWKILKMDGRLPKLSSNLCRSFYSHQNIITNMEFLFKNKLLLVLNLLTFQKIIKDLAGLDQ